MWDELTAHLQNLIMYVCIRSETNNGALDSTIVSLNTTIVLAWFGNDNQMLRSYITYLNESHSTCATIVAFISFIFAHPQTTSVRN